MSLPEFNKDGDLPQGVYKATLKELLNRFSSGSPKRIVLAERLERVYQIALNTGHLARFIIFGSFITDKVDPNDVDIFILMDNDFDYSKVKGETRLLFDNNIAQTHFGCSVFWMRRISVLNGEDKTIRYWQVKRDGTYRGIIEIIKEKS
jgi:hypothetical protein